MTDSKQTTTAPAEWLEALMESEAELEAGLVVPGEVVRQELLDSIARLEGKVAARKSKAASHR